MFDRECCLTTLGTPIAIISLIAILCFVFLGTVRGLVWRQSMPLRTFPGETMVTTTCGEVRWLFVAHDHRGPSGPDHRPHQGQVAVKDILGDSFIDIYL